ncbi:MAG: hypothetical protein JW809_14975 [Pirellulales bacterium]|nr:hypothetical protein [Pirellulales bacterium]
MPCIQSERPEDAYRAREDGPPVDEPADAAEPIEYVELDREAILGADDLPVESVLIPEWPVHGRPGRCFVRTITGEERDWWEVFLHNHRTPDRKLNAKNLRATLVALCACKRSGERLFALDDVERLGKKNAKGLDRIYDKALTLNKLTEKDVEDLVKNSGSDPAVSPPSACAGTSGSFTPSTSSAS